MQHTRSSWIQKDLIFFFNIWLKAAIVNIYSDCFASGDHDLGPIKCGRHNEGQLTKPNPHLIAYCWAPLRSLISIR